MADEKVTQQRAIVTSEDFARCRKLNVSYLREFEDWLVSQGLTNKTVDKHYYNLNFFLEQYLLMQEGLSMEEGIEHAEDFFGSYLVLGIDVPSTRTLKEFVTSIKKFYLCMCEKGHVDRAAYDRLLALIKNRKDDWYAESEAYERQWAYEADTDPLGFSRSVPTGTPIDMNTTGPGQNVLQEFLMKLGGDGVVRVEDFDEEEGELEDEAYSLCEDMLLTFYYLMSRWKTHPKDGKRCLALNAHMIKTFNESLRIEGLLESDSNDEFIMLTDEGVRSAQFVMRTLELDYLIDFIKSRQ